jgi:hypothetical protein
VDLAGYKGFAWAHRVLAKSPCHRLGCVVSRNCSILPSGFVGNGYGKHVVGRRPFWWEKNKMIIHIHNTKQVLVDAIGSPGEIVIMFDHSLEIITHILSLKGGVPGIASDPNLCVQDILDEWRKEQIQYATSNNYLRMRRPNDDLGDS